MGSAPRPTPLWERAISWGGGVPSLVLMGIAVIGAAIATGLKLAKVLPQPWLSVAAFGLFLILLAILIGVVRLAVALLGRWRHGDPSGTATPPVNPASQPAADPVADPFKEVRAIVQSLPADSDAKVEANRTDPTGARASLSVTLGGLAGTGNTTTPAAETQHSEGAAEPPQAEDS
jgi:hypothetical protein